MHKFINYANLLAVRDEPIINFKIIMNKFVMCMQSKLLNVQGWGGGSQIENPFLFRFQN